MKRARTAANIPIVLWDQECRSESRIPPRGELSAVQGLASTVRLPGRTYVDLSTEEMFVGEIRPEPNSACRDAEITNSSVVLCADHLIHRIDLFDRRLTAVMAPQHQLDVLGCDVRLPHHFDLGTGVVTDHAPGLDEEAEHERCHHDQQHPRRPVRVLVLLDVGEHEPCEEGEAPEDEPFLGEAPLAHLDASITRGAADRQSIEARTRHESQRRLRAS